MDYLHSLNESVPDGRPLLAGSLRAEIAGEDVVDSVEQEPENIMDSLPGHADDAKSLFAGGLDDDGDLGMGDVE